MNNAEKLRSLRLKKGLKKTELAKALDISYQSYIRYENGTRELPLKVVIDVAKFYDVPVGYFDEKFSITGIGDGGCAVKNAETSEILEVTADEFSMLKGVLEAFRNQ